jgi:hypothetical protein
MRRYEIKSGNVTAEFDGDESLLVGASLKEQEENLQKFYDRYAKHALAAVARAVEG